MDKEVTRFALKWHLPAEMVRYEAYNYRIGQLANENSLKDSIDYAAYKENNADPVPKFKYRSMMIADFKENLMPAVEPLIS